MKLLINLIIFLFSVNCFGGTVSCYEKGLWFLANFNQQKAVDLTGHSTGGYTTDGSSFVKSKYGYAFTTVGVSQPGAGMFFSNTAVIPKIGMSIYVRVTPDTYLPPETIGECYVDYPFGGDKRVLSLWIYPDNFVWDGTNYSRCMGSEFVLADGYIFFKMPVAADGVEVPISNRPYTLEVAFDSIKGTMTFRKAVGNTFREKIFYLPPEEVGVPLSDITSNLAIGKYTEYGESLNVMGKIEEVAIFNYGDTKAHFMQIHNNYEARQQSD